MAGYQSILKPSGNAAGAAKGQYKSILGFSTLANPNDDELKKIRQQQAEAARQAQAQADAQAKAEKEQKAANSLMGKVKQFGKETVEAAGTTVQKTANTLEAGRLAAGGLIQAGTQAATGNMKAANATAAKTNKLASDYLDKGAGGKGGYLTSKQGKSSGDGLKGAKENFIKPTAAASNDIIQYMPIGKVEAGATLLRRAAMGAAENAAVAGGASVANNAVQGQLNKSTVRDTIRNAATAAAVGAVLPVAGAGGKKAVGAVTNTAAKDLVRNTKTQSLLGFARQQAANDAPAVTGPKPEPVTPQVGGAVEPAAVPRAPQGIVMPKSTNSIPGHVLKETAEKSIVEPLVPNVITKANFGENEAAVRDLTVKHIDALENNNHEAAKAIEQEIAQLPDKGAPELTAKLQQVREQGIIKPVGDAVPAAALAPAPAETLDSYIQGHGEPVYHGTNRNFDTFDPNRSYAARNDGIGAGQGTYFSDNPAVAEKYAGANANESFDKSIIDEIKKANPKAGELLENIYTHGDLEGWQRFEEKYPMQAGQFAEWEKQHFGNIDPNSIGDVAKYIRGAKVEDRGNGLDDVSSMLGGGAADLPDHIKQAAKEMGGVSIPGDPRVMEAYLKPGTKIKDISDTEITNPLDAANAARAEGYQGLRFKTADSVDGVPELNVWDADAIRTRKQLEEEFKSQAAAPAAAGDTPVQTSTVADGGPANTPVQSLERDGSANNGALVDNAPSNVTQKAPEKPVSPAEPAVIAQGADTPKRTLKPSETAHMEPIEGYTHSVELEREFAEMLINEEKGRRGGDLIDDNEKYGHGKVRTTDHSKFYREFYKENKKAPTKADWAEEAKRILESGEAPYGASDIYKQLLNREAQPLPRMKPATSTVADVPQGTAKVAKRIARNIKEEYGSLAKYDKVTIKDQADRAAALISDKDRLNRVISGEEPLPDGLRATSVVTAVRSNPELLKDGELLRKLASSPLASEASYGAQELRLARENAALDPVKAMRNLQETRREAVARRFQNHPAYKGKKDIATKVIADEVKAIRKAKPVVKKEDWSSFIEGLKC